MVYSYFTLIEVWGCAQCGGYEYLNFRLPGPLFSGGGRVQRTGCLQEPRKPHADKKSEMSERKRLKQWITTLWIWQNGILQLLTPYMALHQLCSMRSLLESLLSPAQDLCKEIAYLNFILLLAQPDHQIIRIRS